MSQAFRIPSILLLCLGLSPLGAWTPRFHEAQTRMALSRIPTRMATELRKHSEALLEGARGMPRDQIPTVEELDAQYQKVLQLSEERRAFSTIARELGVLAHMVQLLTDPSCLRGITSLRVEFESFAEQNLRNLVLTEEPYWAVTGPLDPLPRMKGLFQTKTERLAALDACYDERYRKRLVPWDELSVPFALLQLGYSQGVHATANLWILVYRAVGNSW